MLRIVGGLFPPFLLGGLTGGLEGRVTDIVERFGYPGISLLIALETVFPPLPSEVILPLAGFMVGQGRFNIVGVMVSATLGSVVGALLLYGFAAWFGNVRLASFINRYGKYALLSEADLLRSYEWFDRHSTRAVFIGRLVPGVRSLISLPAGVTRMPLPAFVLYTALGSAVWNGLLVGFGWWLGSRWDQVQQYTSILQYAVIAVILAAIAWFVWSRLPARRRFGSRSRPVD